VFPSRHFLLFLKNKEIVAFMCGVKIVFPYGILCLQMALEIYCLSFTSDVEIFSMKQKNCLLPSIITYKWQRIFSISSAYLNMSQVVAPHDYCLENSVHLTRPGSDAFYRMDDSNTPAVIDKHQVKRLYRLQRTPYVNTRVYLNKSDDKSGDFESILRKQINESSIQPTTSVYRGPRDVSDASMARFSFGKSRPDPQRIVPSETTTVRNHPAAITILR